jgi:ribonuclease Z
MNRIELFGRSVAGLETCVEVPGLKLLLDLGVCSRSAVNLPCVLLSHGHLDHMGSVALHAARRALLGMTPGTYVVPRAIAPAVERLFNAAGELDGQSIPRRIVALGPGDEEPLGKNRFVRAFETFHRVPSQGYTVWEKRTRLRDEFAGLPGVELGALRRQGVVLDETHVVPLLSFTGDTRVEVLERTPELQLTECLVVECSFLDGLVSVEQAREMGHVHLDELLARQELLPRGDVVLSHFSARYQPHDILRIISQRLPDALRETTRTLPES